MKMLGYVFSWATKPWPPLSLPHATSHPPHVRRAKSRATGRTDTGGTAARPDAGNYGAV